MNPNQEDEPWVSTSVPACVAIVAKAAAELSIVERPSARVDPPLLALDGSMLLGICIRDALLVHYQFHRRVCVCVAFSHPSCRRV